MFDDEGEIKRFPCVSVCVFLEFESLGVRGGAGRRRVVTRR